jgi:cell division protein DivIC
VNWSKAINSIYAALFLVVAVWAGLFFLQMHRELTALRAQENQNRQRLAAAEAKLKEQQEYLARLQRDPELVERVIRRKLGYARPEEFVFRFEEPAAK